MGDRVTSEFAGRAVSEASGARTQVETSRETRLPAVRVLRQTMTVCSEDHVQVVDLTQRIREFVRDVDVKEGLLLINTLHTTCALFVNEFQGALIEDLITMLRQLVADKGGFKHDDSRYSDCERGNASAHLRAALVGRSVVVGISEGELSLGRFQSILFAELDGPRSRGIDIQILGG